MAVDKDQLRSIVTVQYNFIPIWEEHNLSINMFSTNIFTSFHISNLQNFVINSASFLTLKFTPVVNQG